MKKSQKKIQGIFSVWLQWCLFQDFLKKCPPKKEKTLAEITKNTFTAAAENPFHAEIYVQQISK